MMIQQFRHINDRGPLRGYCSGVRLFSGAAVAVDVLPRSFHAVLIVSHQMQFMIGVGVVLRLEQLGTGLAYLPHEFRAVIFRRSDGFLKDHIVAM